MRGRREETTEVRVSLLLGCGLRTVSENVKKSSHSAIDNPVTFVLSDSTIAYFE